VTGQKKDFFYATATAILVLIALIILLLDYEKMAGLLLTTDYELIFYAILLTVFSYLAHAFSFWAASRLFKIKIPLAELLEIGFVSSVLTNILSAAGIPGNTYRIIMMKKSQVSSEDVTAVTVFHSYFNGSVFLLLLPVSFLFIYNASFITNGEFYSLAAASALFVLLFALATTALFAKTIRGIIIGLVVSIAGLLHKKNDVAAFLAKFSEAIERGKKETKTRPFLLFLLVFFLLADWVAMIFALGYCFAAFGTQVGFGKLLVGFTSGTVAGAISFVPGGLGIFEGSTAGMFALLGTGLESAVLAVLLFRIVYYLFPFGVSLLIFGKIILRSRKETAALS